MFRDIQLAHQDRILTPTNKTTDKWFGAEYNVARNKRGWAFAYIIKDDIMYIYDIENCRNLTLDYQNTEPFVMSNIDEPQQRQNFSMGYKISACRLDDGYIYLYKNGRQVPDYRFNEILNVFRKHKNGEIYAVGLYGGKKFKITLATCITFWTYWLNTMPPAVYWTLTPTRTAISILTLTPSRTIWPNRQRKTRWENSTPKT